MIPVCSSFDKCDFNTCIVTFQSYNLYNPCFLPFIVTLFQESVFNIVLTYTGFSFVVRESKCTITNNCQCCCYQKLVGLPQQDCYIDQSQTRLLSTTLSTRMYNFVECTCITECRTAMNMLYLMCCQLYS